MAAIEKATGGKTEIGSFAFDWKTMTARVDGFVLHGTEPSGARRCFRQVRYGHAEIISVFGKKSICMALDVIEPEIHLIVHDDGSTNIPSPK